MHMFVNSRTLYAAIEARHLYGAVDRFVIAYTCEQSLRELLAEPSIVASGCPTREDAEAICRGETPACDRRQPQLPRVFGLNAITRFALGFRESMAEKRSLYSTFFTFVSACLRTDWLHLDAAS